MYEKIPSRLHLFLKHYYALLENHTVALYLRSKSIPVTFDPESSMDILWEIHQNIAPEIYQKDEFRSLPPTAQTLLDLKIHISRRMLLSCNFCNHGCKVDRTSEGLGYCGQSDRSCISSAFLHRGEEAPLIPSGTIFFNGCTFDCVFCQNSDISSKGKKGITKREDVFTHQEVSGSSLASIATALHHQGARNINYVGGDPTPHLHTILHSMKFLKENICQLWNSNLYLSEDALWLLMDVIDVWLPDLKYGNNECALKYSGIQQYWDILTRNLTFLYTHGSKNIIIRHLVMPGHIDCCTKPLLSWVAREIPNVILNIMGQYHPDYKISADRFPELNRRVTSAEIESAFAYADMLNLEHRSVS